jgi:hypothetical protein
MTSSAPASSKLAPFEILADLPPEEIAALESALEERDLPRGKDVYREGEPARYCYFLEAGSVSLWRRRGNEEEQIRVLQPGEIFGEEGIPGTERRHASAFVESDARVLRIGSESLRARLRSLPQTEEVLRRVARGRRLTRGAAFGWLAPDETVFVATRKANLLLLPGLALPIGLGLACLAAAAVVYRQGWPEWAYLPVGAGLALAVLAGAWSAVDWGNDYYLVTSRRVIALRRVPLVYDDRQETTLDMIQSVGVTRTAVQRALGFGDVVVRTFTRPIVFQSVPDPNGIARLLETVRKRRLQTQEADDRAEIGRLLAQRLQGKRAGEASLEEAEPAADASAPAAGTPARLSGIETRREAGGAVTYRKHLFFLLRNCFLPALLALAGIPLAAAVSQGFVPVDRGLGYLLAGGAILAGLAWCAYEYADWANDLYQVTPDQILALHRKPLGDEERRAAALENILSLEYDRPSLLARLFNFGTVVATVGQVNFTFDEVGDPVHVQEDIFRRMECRKRQAADSQRRRRREEIADWIETYHELTRREAGADEGKEPS